MWISAFPELKLSLRRIVATSCTLLGFVFSCVAVSSCSFVGRKSDGASVLFDDYAAVYLPESDFDVRFGMWKFELAGGTSCLDYDDYSYLVEVDAAVEVARAFGVMSALFGGIVLVTMLIGLFLVFPIVLWRVIMSFLFVIAIFQLLTLSFFGSNLCTNLRDAATNANYDRYYDDCLPDVGAGCAIVAFLFWITAGIFTCLVPAKTIPIIKLCNESGCCCECDDCEWCSDHSAKNVSGGQGSGSNVGSRNSTNMGEVVTVDPDMVTVVNQ